MSPQEIYRIRVLEYDFATDKGEFVPDARQEKYLYGIFIAQASSKKQAHKEIEERTGWTIKKLVFLR